MFSLFYNVFLYVHNVVLCILCCLCCSMRCFILSQLFVSVSYFPVLIQSHSSHQVQHEAAVYFVQKGPIATSCW